jgi:hypothetical protein
MQFAGPDLMVSKFQVNIIVVTENVFTEETLQRAATQLLIAWPLLSFRTNLTVSVIAKNPKIRSYEADRYHPAHCSFSTCREEDVQRLL